MTHSFYVMGGSVAGLKATHPIQMDTLKTNKFGPVFVFFVSFVVNKS